MKYNDAEIYLTSCTHPEYSFLRYIGLDTKKDKNYLGSSIVLKWFINKLGRSYFSKEVLDTVSGSMAECCELEQKYILEHDAVRNQDYLNMNGGKQGISCKDVVMSFDFSVVPSTSVSKDFIKKVMMDVRDNIYFHTFARGQLASQIICILLYGFIKYEQVDFEYSTYSSYGGCSSDAVEEVVSCLSSLGYIDSSGSIISITNKLIESTPDTLGCEDFISTLRGQL